MALIKMPILLQDLSATTRRCVAEGVRFALREELEREEGETDEDFEQRRDEATDDYLNRHNFAVEFAL